MLRVARTEATGVGRDPRDRDHRVVGEEAITISNMPGRCPSEVIGR